MRRRWMHFIAVLLFFVGANQASVAAEQPLARILEVNRATTSGTPHGPAQLQMPKFLSTDAPVDGDAYRVTWEPLSRALPVGVQVTFEYTQQRASGVKSLMLQYPFAVRERRTATFRIADRAYQLGGPVADWRVRVVRDGRVLAEKTSAYWSDSP